jgi:hypothetical protein
MTRTLLTTVLLAGLGLSPALQAQSPTLTNTDIRRLVALHVSDRTVIAVINEATTTKFDLSLGALSGLAKAGVSNLVISAMRQPSRPNAASTNSTVTPTPSPTAGTRTIAGAAAAPARESAATTSTGATDGKDEAYWRGRLQTLQAKLDGDIEAREPLKSRLAQLLAPSQATVPTLAAEVTRVSTEVDRLNALIAEDNKAIADLKEEGARAGAPPGWFQ